MMLTKDQAKRLKDVLYDAITGWDFKIEFPASLTDIIDARIAWDERMIEGREEWDRGFVRDVKARIEAYRELRLTVVSENK